MDEIILGPGHDPHDLTELERACSYSIAKKEDPCFARN